MRGRVRISQAVPPAVLLDAGPWVGLQERILLDGPLLLCLEDRASQLSGPGRRGAPASSALHFAVFLSLSAGLGLKLLNTCCFVMNETPRHIKKSHFLRRVELALTLHRWNGWAQVWPACACLCLAQCLCWWLSFS